ncbi:hypothetical protein K435DRAFT_600433, partial [Dendrothele bispora CBS 962.96]
VSELPALLDKLIQELDERKEKIARAKNLLSPIRRLPAEMLTEIFMNYIEPDAQRLYNALPRPLLLSQICAQWRNLVQFTPRLW